MNDFLSELLDLVHRQVKRDAHDDRSPAFLNAILTCRQWYEIGKAILWTDVSLRGSRLIKFTKSPGTTSGHHIRSLSIKVPAYGRYWPDPKSMYNDQDAVISSPLSSSQVYESLYVLPNALKCMINLESFSFMLPELDTSEEEVLVRRCLQDLQGILLALPTSLRHFEFDTNCLEDKFNHTDFYEEAANDGLEESRTDQEVPHLCPVLAKIMHNVDNMRLRIGALCHEVFPTSTYVRPIGTCETETVTVKYRSRNIIISMVAEVEYIHRFRQCHERYHRLVSPGHRDANKVLQSIVSRARDFVFNCGQEGDSVRLSVFSLQSPQNYSQEPNLYHQAINQRILLSSPAQTSRLKKMLCKRGRRDEKCFLRYVDNEGDVTDVFGKWRDIENIAEGEVWIETATGNRMSKEYFNHQSRFETSLLRIPVITELSCLADRRASTLFELERIEGKKLLVGYETECLDEVGTLRRDLTRKEKLEETVSPAQSNVMRRRFWWDGGIYIPA